MKSLWFKVTPLLIFLFLAAACSTPLKLTNVLITITDYRPTTNESKANLKLHLSNENVFPLAIGGITGKLYLEGNYVGNFEISKAIGIPRLGAVDREAELQIEKPAIIQKLRASSAPSISYRLDNKLHMEVSEERSNSSTEAKGQIDSAWLRAEPVK